MRLELVSFSPERPTPGSWFAFVLLGLIGTYLAGATLNAAVGGLGDAETLIVFGSVVLGSYSFANAYTEGLALDETEDKQ
jgi:hypothetical protein